MEAQSEATDETANIKDIRQQIESRIETVHNSQLEIISSLQHIVPDISSSLNLHLKVVSSFNGRQFTPLPNPLPIPNPTTKRRIQSIPIEPTFKISKLDLGHKVNELIVDNNNNNDDGGGDDGGVMPLVIVRSMVAVCLLERVPFTEIDSVELVGRLESEGFQSVTVSEKAALKEVAGAGGESVVAVEMALRAIADDTGGVHLDEFKLNGKDGKVRVLVKGIDRTRLVKELPESKHNESNSNNSSGGNVNQERSVIAGVTGPGAWGGQGDGGQFGGGMMGPRGMMGVVGRPPMHRPPSMGMYSPMGGGGGGGGGGGLNTKPPRTEEDDLKDLEALLNKKSFKELQKSKTGEELLDLIHRPTARETAVAAKFKSKGGSQVKEYCSALTKEDCRRQSGSFISCEKVHFRRIIAAHTDMNLGDCSFLDTCRHMKTCKYVHYELDSTPDVPNMLAGPSKPLKSQRAEYCSEVELGESQWINCDIRNFRMDILGQYGVIMADPPWDIHMELPYGTMADDEMRNLNIQALQTDGLIFLWVTGRAMELGRECLELWGYQRVEEIIWVKTNQLQRIIRTGRTGHWLNHSKEHCLVGIKGDPIVNRNIDTDVIVAEVRETSRKPDEMYPLLERISPRTRKLELFARMHNTHAGWMSLGNQLSGARLVDEGLRARFKAAYPEVEVQPQSPPRASAMEVEGGQSRSPFSRGESQPMSGPFTDVRSSEATNYAAAGTGDSNPRNADVEMTTG
ncbi:putative N(6)-adenosine-methyltransferase MT-A70-like [Bidens hawaiensis]|uniref:putative N(6)-adenosine-methyltransferase MT-A70-like n=1 Tax=Bidens hawaiensis TaxID=980011 RepID=UPI00404959E0